jgi:DNA-damage-inducible protein D
MPNETSPGDQQVSAFERIRHMTADGVAYWSARELAEVLGYARWDKFKHAIAKAQVACETSGYAPSDHFSHVGRMVTLGSGAQRQIEEYHLSRYACYLVVQNADPSKEIVALGQTYFAVRTREAELADEIASLSEEQQRLRLRAEMRQRNAELAVVASTAGVVTSKDFAIFQDHGYRGLYGGETARDIAARKGLGRGQHILDHMGSTELAANWFRATQAADKIRRDEVASKSEANRIHHDVGAAVRRFIVEDLGGTPPEQLPAPSQSIQELERAEQRRLASERQPSLFDEPSPHPDEDES